jgi:hypothetical protein
VLAYKTCSCSTLLDVVETANVVGSLAANPLDPDHIQRAWFSKVG